MKKIILVDGNSILFRAYYATAYPGATLMQTKSGEYTNALFAFVNMFEKIQNEAYDAILVCFDTSEKTKRHLAFEGYKAKRDKMPEELAEQFPRVYEYLSLIGVKTHHQVGYEADDIIGIIANQAKQNQYQVDIYSSDKDLLQLVDEKVTVHLLKKGMKEVHHFTPETLFETYQLNHQQMIDLKALMGDPSDNIPGIPGIGEKTATKLLQTYQTLENIFVNKDKLTPKLKVLFDTYEAQAYLCKNLVTIDTTGDLTVSLADLSKKVVDQAHLIKFFQQYELHQFVKKMDVQSSKNEEWVYEVVDDEIRLSQILKPNMAIYFEFSDQNYHRADLWGLSLSDGKHHYFITKETALSSFQLSLYFQDESIEKYIYNYKASLVYLWWQGLTLEGVSFDLLLAAYLVNAHLGKEEFKYIVSAFDYDDVNYDDVIYNKGVKKGLPEDEKIYQKHIVSKAKAIFDLKDRILKQLNDIEQLSLYQDIELPLSKVLAHMEYTGIYVDQETLDLKDKELSERIEEVSNHIYQLSGQTFTISSPKQLGEILFEKLQLPYGKKTKTGYSTNVEVLESLKHQHPIISYIMEYRQLTKLHSTYIIGVKQALFEDGKVHTIYQQALTTTGRLSSIEPNLQNIPIRTNLGKEIRKLFVSSSDDTLLLGADYSQIELRILAEIANVDALKEAFLNKEDIHTKTAQSIFHKQDVTANERRAAKAVNFGIIYGMKAYSLSEDIHVSVYEAQQFIDAYFKAFPQIKDYMTNIVLFARENGYVKTLFQRRRYIPEIHSNVFVTRSFGERTALNAPIQGTAADIIKKAMVDLYRYITKQKLKSKILLQVHDELILEVPSNELEQMKEKVVEIMTNAYKMSVPLETSLDVGKTWYDLD